MAVLKEFEKKYGQNRVTTNVKVSDEEQAMIEKKAKQFTKGNVSAWIRYAATKHIPTKRELVTPRKKAA